MKKLLVCLGLSLCAHSVAARHHMTHHRVVQHTPTPKGKFYLGLATGAYRSDVDNNSYTWSDTAGNDMLKLSNQVMTNQFSPLSQIEFGYQRCFKNLFVDASVSLKHADQTINGETTLFQQATPFIDLNNLVTVKTHGFDTNMNLRMGKKLWNKLDLYGLVGLARSKFTVRVMSRYRYQSGGNIDTGTVSTTQSHFQHGYKLGAGARTALSKQLSLQIEYSYYQYHRINQTQTAPVNGAQASDTISVMSSVRPKLHAVTLGINYRLRTV